MKSWPLNTWIQSVDSLNTFMAIMSLKKKKIHILRNLLLLKAKAMKSCEQMNISERIKDLNINKGEALFNKFHYISKEIIIK